MKRVLAIFLALTVIISCLSMSVFAEDGAALDIAAAATVTDGFDFYSMTVYYTTPVVVGYKYVVTADNVVKKDKDGNVVKDEDGNDVILNKAWIFDDAQSEYVVPVNQYMVSTDDGDKTSQVLAYGDTALKNKKYNTLFYGIDSTDLGLLSTGLAINTNYGITNIDSGTALTSISSVNVYGVREYYDDAGTPNPNFTMVDGYFLDQSVDAEGNNLRIDINGFVIDANNIWHSADGHRIEPFVETDENVYTWINLKSRLGEDGKVIDYTTITNQILIDSGVLTLPSTYAILGANDEYDATVDYDGDGEIKAAKDKKAYTSLVKAKKNWLESCDIQMYTIDYQDTNGDGKKTEDDLAGYNAADFEITQEMILIQKDKDGTPKTDINGNPFYVHGTPELGNPVTKVEISKLTVEIDAAGDQLYSDVASDPQQQNSVTITCGDLYTNIKTALDYVAEHPEKTYTDGVIIGTAKCVTTKTESVSESGYPSTMKSVEVVMEEGAAIPANAVLFFNFNVAVSQKEETKSYISKTQAKSALMTINKLAINLDNLPDADLPEEEESTGCFGTISGAAAVVALLGAAFVVVRKKEN